MIEELLDLRILEVLAHPEKEYTQDDDWLLKLKRKCMFRQKRLKKLFDMTVSKTSHPVHLANRFLSKVGLGLVGERKRVNGKRVYVYKLDTEKLNNHDRLAILKALDTKWSQTKAKSGLDGVHESA